MAVSDGLVARRCAGREAAAADFAPGTTNLVQAAWLPGIGCPTDAEIAVSNATGTGIDHKEPFTELACPSGDPNDAKNEGLLLAKTGPTNNFASAGAELKGCARHGRYRAGV